MEQGFFHVTLPHNYFSLVLYLLSENTEYFNILPLPEFLPALGFYHIQHFENSK